MSGCQGCCIFPHGRLSIYAMILAVSSYLFVISASWGCYYVEVGATFSENIPGLTVDFKSGIGLFSYEDVLDFNNNNNQLTCYYYTGSQIDAMDGAFKAARVFGVLANIFIGVSMLVLVAVSCMEYPQVILKVVGGMLLAGSLFELLTLTFFASDVCNYDCDFYIGAGMAIGGTIVCFMTAIVVLQIPPAMESSLDLQSYTEQAVAYAPGTETITETALPDGTKKIIKTHVHGDGSKTIEETLVA